MDSARVLAHEAHLAKHLGGTETLPAHGDEVAVGEFIGFLLDRLEAVFISPSESKAI